jgi:hypothetical protein
MTLCDQKCPPWLNTKLNYYRKTFLFDSGWCIRQGKNCYGMPKVGWREVAERNIGFSRAEPQKQILITGLRKAGWEPQA